MNTDPLAYYDKPQYDRFGRPLAAVPDYSNPVGEYGNPYARVVTSSSAVASQNIPNNNDYNAGSYYSTDTVDGVTQNTTPYVNFDSTTNYEDYYRTSFDEPQNPDNGIDSVSAIAQGVKLGQGLFNAYLGYQNLREAKENNARNYSLALENNRREAIRYQNKVNEKKRNAGLLTSNSNSSLATARVIARTPYRGY